jgi:hypothetical protein
MHAYISWHGDYGEVAATLLLLSNLSPEKSLAFHPSAPSFMWAL